MAIWRQVLIIIFLAGAGFGGWLGWEHWRGKEQAAAAPTRGGRSAAVEIAVAEWRRMERTVEAVGTARARRSVDIVPYSAGRLVRFDIEPGERVKAGQVLARLDDEIERADLAEAKAVLEEQQLATERAEELWRRRAVPQSTLEEAKAKLAIAKASLDRAIRRLADRVIEAPFAGVVGMAEMEPGARVEAGDMMTMLDDLSEVEVEFSLPESLFAEIRAGMPVSAISAAFPGREFTGRVTEINNRIDPVSRAFRARAVIPNPDGALPPGMFLSLSLTLSAEEAVVTPEEAIIAAAGDTYVFVVSESRANRRKVRTGLRRGGLIVVEEGLEPGEAVVIRGIPAVRDGREVNVLNDGAERPRS